VIVGNLVTLLIYFGAFIFKKTHRIANNFFYDIFMGVWLNPRIGSLDLKIWAEIRISWTLLFFLTAGAAAKQYELYGQISWSMALMLLAHFLYSNACQKGEECIPTTWDIFYENWGWMLIFWNFAGVPFLYCFQSMYILRNPPREMSIPFTVFLFTLLISAYYIWDTSNSQKNRFRMQRQGTFVQRWWAFPQLPWGTLYNPKHIKTDEGNLILIDGWFRYARKIHYSADLTMALCWGLACGYAVLPYFYFVFFFFMLSHRGTRDMERCSQKYGKYWDKYCETVPYIFIPYLY